MTALVTRWLVRWAVVRALAIVATGQMTGLEAKNEVLRRIPHMDLPELLYLKYRWDTLGERTAPPSAIPDGSPATGGLGRA